MGSESLVSFKKTIFLRLCVTMVMLAFQCNSYPASYYDNKLKKTMDKDVNVAHLTVDQDDFGKIHQSFCQVGNVHHVSWPKTCIKEQRFHVHFETPFQNVPRVNVALNGLDIDNRWNSRLRVEAVDIGKIGFTIKITTWADTKLYSAGASWTACDSEALQIISTD